MQYYVDLATLFLIALTAVVGVFALTGLTGLFSFGQGGFMALGAYTAVLTNMRLGVPFPIALLLGVVMAVAASLLIGFPALKLRRDFFALATFGFGEAVTAIFQMFTQVTGGTMGLPSIPRYTEFWMALLVAASAVYLVANFKNTKMGRQSIAIRNDELAAQALGINAFRHKMIVFAFSAGLAGLAGGLQGFFIHYMDPRIFGWTTSVEQVIIVYFGGINSLTGCVVSALLLTTMPELLRFASMWRVTIYAALIILTMNLRPQGLLGDWELTRASASDLYRRLRRAPVEPQPVEMEVR
ncbi:MAG TPA: branched-chain amino acid ABC transporter permease [Chloroflexota bacterium]|nr:branched-chain amino acid ABC transporter permease [Chloroflexota bacterium]